MKDLNSDPQIRAKPDTEAHPVTPALAGCTDKSVCKEFVGYNKAN